MNSADALKGIGARLEGTTIQGQYFIEKLIQRGGMAWLYKARHKILQEPMAIKILFPQWSDDPLVRVRFIDEAKIQFKLKHPNIVQVTDVIEDDGLLGIVQEWVDGEDLDNYISRSEKPLSLEEIWLVAEPLLAALEFAHDMGVVHRDIKPSNVLLGRIGNRITPKLADFGIAKILDELGERTTTGTTLGTMKFIAPEQIRDSKTVDHRADIYGFGVMLYRLATGQYPFSGKLENVMFKQLYEPPPRPRELNEELSPELEEVILQCLTKHPEDRFPDCNEVLESLRPLMPKNIKKSARGNLFTGFTRRHPADGTGEYARTNTPRDAIDDSSPSAGSHIKPMPPNAEVSSITSQSRNAAPSLVDNSSPNFAHSIEALRSMAPKPPVDEFPIERGGSTPARYNSDPYTPPPQFSGQPHAHDHSASFHSAQHPPGVPSHTMDVPAHNPSASPFASPGAGESPWGEFMLETEDEYEIDDAPTEIPQHSPFASTNPVEVRLGSHSGGSLVPFPEDNTISPQVMNLDQIMNAPYEDEPEDAATMLGPAPSMEEIIDAGVSLQHNQAGDAARPSKAQAATPQQPTPQPAAPSQATPQPAAPSQAAPQPAPHHLAPPLESPSFTSLPSASSASLPSASSSSLPARLSGSDLFAMRIAPSSQSLDAVPASMLPPQEPAPSIVDKEPTPPQPAPPPKTPSVADVLEAVPASRHEEGQISRSEAPLASADLESWQKSQKGLSPLLFYPLIGIFLGLFVLGTAWLVMRLKNESNRQQQHLKDRTPSRRAAQRKDGTPPPLPSARASKPTPQAALYAGCKKKWPKDKQPHQLKLTLKPKEMIALHHPKLRDFVKGSICLEYFKSPTITLSRNGFDDCTITLTRKSKTLTATLKKAQSDKKRAKDYCIK